MEVYNATVIFTASDFGRTLSSNGAGTDHAWAGQHLVLGGGLRGGRVFNDYPESLLDGTTYAHKSYENAFERY